MVLEKLAAALVLMIKQASTAKPKDVKNINEKTLWEIKHQ